MGRKQALPGKAGSPFSKAVKANGLWFVTGHVTSKEDMVVGDIGAQTRGTLRNLQRTLTECGCTMNDVVRCTVYLTNINDFANMNEAYKEFFGAEPPARTTIGIKELASPDYLIEIDLIALANE